MKKPKIKEGQCVYCGQIAKLTKDHVIPKAIFTKPYPPQLITVPACEACNNITKSADDDYLRDILVCDIYGATHPAAQANLDSMMRAAERGRSDVIQQAIATVNIESVYTPAGIYLGDFPQFKIDEPRMKNLLARMARGIYYDYRKQIIPHNYSVEVLRYNPWDFKEIYTQFTSRHINGPRVIGDVFGCVYLAAQEDLYSTWWLMWFYESVIFTVWMANPELSKLRRV